MLDIDNGVSQDPTQAESDIAPNSSTKLTLFSLLDRTFPPSVVRRLDYLARIGLVLPLLSVAGCGQNFKATDSSSQASRESSSLFPSPTLVLTPTPIPRVTPTLDRPTPRPTVTPEPPKQVESNTREVFSRLQRYKIRIPSDWRIYFDDDTRGIFPDTFSSQVQDEVVSIAVNRHFRSFDSLSEYVTAIKNKRLADAGTLRMRLELLAEKPANIGKGNYSAVKIDSRLISSSVSISFSEALVVVNGSAFSLSYGAADPKIYKRYLDTFEQAAQSFEPLP